MRQSILRRAVFAGVCTALMGTAGALFAANGQSLFGEIGQSATMQAKVNTAWNQLFYGDNNTQRVYFPVGSDMAYIKDINNNDVRTEGMSYGMMIAAQMNKKTEFNRLWKWAKTYMQHTSGPYKGYFSWQNRTDGSKIDNHSASDGEEYFVQALFTASGRWGNGTGIYNYRAEANAILNTMLHQKDDGSGVNMFHGTYNQVVFTPQAQNDVGTTPGFGTGFTDPSYHVPAFYTKWAAWANKDKQIWSNAAAASRWLFNASANASTGLFPNQSNFDGSPYAFNSGQSYAGEWFSYDAYRTVMNMTVDAMWNGADRARESAIATRQHTFFWNQGIDKYVGVYDLSGNAKTRDRSAALIAMNGVAAEISTHANRLWFVQRLWDMPIPSGQYRYYDGMLYMFAVLIASGNYHAYTPR